MVRCVQMFASGMALAMTPMAAQAATLHPDMEATPIGNVADWFSVEDYPKDAASASKEGRVVAAVGVDSAGEVVACSIEISSGTPSLDTRTCEIATAHLTFKPATDHQGRPKSGVYRLPVMWKLPDHEHHYPLDLTAGGTRSAVELEITFDADGTILKCTPHSVTWPLFTAGASAERPDPCQAAQPGTKSPRRWMRNGQPVGAVVVQRVTEDATATP